MDTYYIFVIYLFSCGTGGWFHFSNTANRIAVSIGILPGWFHCLWLNMLISILRNSIIPWNMHLWHTFSFVNNFNTFSHNYCINFVLLPILCHYSFVCSTSSPAGRGEISGLIHWFTPWLWKYQGSVQARVDPGMSSRFPMRWQVHKTEIVTRYTPGNYIQKWSQESYRM